MRPAVLAQEMSDLALASRVPLPRILSGEVPAWLDGAIALLASGNRRVDLTPGI